MFGSNDDKKNPAPAGEKKGLFGWLRKKPQETVAEQPPELPAAATEPSVEATPVVAEPQIAPSITAEAVTAALPVAEPAPGALEAQVVILAETSETVSPPPQPWLTLPVAEESVALTPEVEPHVTPQIPPHTESAVPDAYAPEPERAPAKMVEPIAADAAPAVAPVIAAPMVATVVDVAPDSVPATVESRQPGFFARLKQGLSKTSASLGEGMASLFLGKKAIDDDMLDELETRLLTADVGVEATSLIVRNLTQKVARKQLTDSDALYKSLQNELTEMLKPVESPLVIDSTHKPFVILVVGVNGAGKTTTIGKLAKKLQLDGKKVMLAAGDTFRAAAVEQLQVWGERNKIPVIAQHTGADSASVIFDAVQAAKARGIDVLIADTAGRLHTKDNLMEELKKVRRVIGKLDADAPHEVLLVLDAGTGQNAISQAKQFHQTVTLTGLALTKLDGTAKGGVIFALAKQFGLPIRYVGVGEGIDDLRTFEAEPFVQALFSERERT
jgi:fused signal recognition particle receptor